MKGCFSAGHNNDAGSMERAFRYLENPRKEGCDAGRRYAPRYRLPLILTPQFFATNEPEVVSLEHLCIAEYLDIA